jgi:hypothetical protein
MTARTHARVRRRGSDETLACPSQSYTQIAWRTRFWPSTAIAVVSVYFSRAKKILSSSLSSTAGDGAILGEESMGLLVRSGNRFQPGHTGSSQSGSPHGKLTASSPLQALVPSFGLIWQMLAGATPKAGRTTGRSNSSGDSPLVIAITVI